MFLDPSPSNTNQDNEGEAWQANTITIPQAYLCQITKQIMRDPVILFDDGLTYERETLQKWLDLKTNPITKDPMKNSGIFANAGLKAAIDAFIAKHANNKSVQEQVYITKQGRLDRDWLDAAKHGASIKEFRGILEAGANNFARDIFGDTVLHLACSSPRPLETAQNVLKALAEEEKQEQQNANNNNEQKDEQDPANMQHDFVGQLLAMVNNLGQSALHEAVRLNKGKLVVFFIQHGRYLFKR